MPTFFNVSVFAGLFGFYIIWCLTRLLGNYRKARLSGFPIHVTPTNPENVLVVSFTNTIRPYFTRLLPTFLNDRVQLAINGWDHLTKYSVQERLGTAFMLVTSGTNQLWIADPELAQHLLHHRKDYVQTPIYHRGYLSNKWKT
jgi:hypothetical protein